MFTFFYSATLTTYQIELPEDYKILYSKDKYYAIYTIQNYE